MAYVKTRQRKRLAYYAVSYVLLRVEKEITEKLMILYENKTVQNIDLVEVKITNSGNVPIVPSDYERPIYVFLGENAEILNFEVREKEPRNLQVEARARLKQGTNRNQVEVKPILLNPRDYFKLQFLVTRLDKIEVDARIAGVKQVELSKETTAVAIKSAILSIAMFLCIAVLGISRLLFTQFEAQNFATIIIFTTSIALALYLLTQLRQQ